MADSSACLLINNYNDNGGSPILRLIFRSNHPHIPLVVVPTSFNQVTEIELAERGFNIVIYANHLMRASYPAMQQTALEILRHSRSAEADKYLMSISEVLELIPGTK